MKSCVVLTSAILAWVCCTGVAGFSEEKGTDLFDSTESTVGGLPRDPFDYSWSVALLFRKDGKLLRKCGGVRLSQKYLVTAAECVEPSNYPPGTTIHVVHASLSTNSTKDTMVSDMSFQLIATLIHPLYDPTNFIHNIAIVMPYRLSEYKNSPLLPAFREEDKTFVNETAFAFKWISTSPGTDSADNLKLFAVPTKIIESSLCKAHYLKVSDNQICGINYRSNKITKNDFGVPLVMMGRNSKPVLIGVGFPMQPTNNSDFPPVVFTRVPLYSEWIYQRSGKKVAVKGNN